MRNYLDPVYLAVTEDAWRRREYAEIFAAFNQMLTDIEEVETGTETLYKLIKFKMSQAWYAQIYNHNPFRNEPKVKEFYAQQFERIIAEFCQRVEWCPGTCALDSQALPSFRVKNPLVPLEVLTEWYHLLQNCLSCDSKELLCCLGPMDRQATAIESDSAFIREKLWRTHQVVQLFHIPWFVSKEVIGQPGLRETSLRHAIEILYQQRLISDRWEPNHQPQQYVFEDSFWRDLERGQLGHEDETFREQLVSSMTQVVYDIVVDIRKHTHKGEDTKILIYPQKYTRYSADVFKMGRGTTDQRCSRIFYCKVKSVIHFCEYDPDFHGGE